LQFKNPGVPMKYILPIGGGKGGAGKSFITGNLGISLATQGGKTLLVDVDLGTANLHTMLGLPNSEKSLSDFTNKNVETLDEIIIKTSLPNLFIISGAGNTLNAANLPYQQKMKILRAIPKLSYDYILLDLGAGTSFNTIDFFMISDSGIFVTTPEPTSIENVYRLIRSIFLRKTRYVLDLPDFNAIVEKVLVRNKGTNVSFLADLLYMVKDEYPEKGHFLEQSLQALQFTLIVNQLRKRDNPNLGVMMCKLVERHLGIKMRFAGNIDFDDRVHNAVCDKLPFIHKYPYTKAATDLREICNNILLMSTQETKSDGKAARAEQRAMRTGG